MINLKKLRGKIDGIDTEILKLLNERTKAALEIGALKTAKGGSIYVPDREKEVYRRVVEQNSGPLMDKTIRAVYREIMSGALALEKPMKVAYLGPEATFTNLASLKKFGSSVTYVPRDNITEIFVEVERGRADYGVVPIENSVEGAVNHTLDMFIDSDLKICSEIYLEISHNLLAAAKDKKRIKRIYSNPQVFGQCRLWLEANMPSVELVEVSSTTRAAKLASRYKDSAAIASVLAAQSYGLKVLYKSIEDSPYNITRFLVIGKTETKPTKDDKTSIIFSVKDKAGALQNMLLTFKNFKINLTKIESRPSKKKPWEYYFFADMQGHCQDKKVKNALDELEKKANFVKILGSYSGEI